MATERARVAEEPPAADRHEVPAAPEAAPAVAPTADLAALGHTSASLTGPRRPGRGYESSHTASLLGMQQALGNRAVQRLIKRDAAAPATRVPPDLGARLQAAAGSGRPLEPDAQGQLEHGLAADLSGVRVHADPEADHLARAVEATAFTTGSDIFFRAGAYRPSSSDGLRLLAHEAAHTVQQAEGPVAGTPTEGVSVSDPADPFEQAAQRAAEAVATSGAADATALPLPAGRPLPRSAANLQRRAAPRRSQPPITTALPFAPLAIQRSPDDEALTPGADRGRSSSGIAVSPIAQLVIQRQVNPYLATERATAWEQGYRDGLATPATDLPPPSPYTLEQQQAYTEGVSAAQPGASGSSSTPGTAGPGTSGQRSSPSTPPGNGSSPRGGQSLASNPYGGTDKESAWQQGYNAGLADPMSDLPPPTPYSLDQQQAYSEGASAGQQAAGAPTTASQPKLSPFQDRLAADPMRARAYKPIQGVRGNVIGYFRTSGGYSEVVNTNGDLMWSDEIPLEHGIPIIDPALDLAEKGLQQLGYAVVGTIDAVLEDNWRALGLPVDDDHQQPLAKRLGIPADATAYSLGRGAGHVVALVQAGAELVGGATLFVSGAGEFMAGVATTPAGIGVVVAGVGVVSVVGGATVVIHGGALGSATFHNMMSSGSGRGGGEPNKRSFDPPSRDATGKVHGELPKEVPESWTKEDLLQAQEELQESIATRKAEQLRLGEDPPHRVRIAEEETLLRQIIKRLSGS